MVCYPIFSAHWPNETSSNSKPFFICEREYSTTNTVNWYCESRARKIRRSNTLKEMNSAIHNCWEYNKPNQKLKKKKYIYTKLRAEEKKSFWNGNNTTTIAAITTKWKGNRNRKRKMHENYNKPNEKPKMYINDKRSII